MTKTATKLATLTIVSSMLALSLGACGGDASPVDQTHNESLADGDGEFAGKTCDSYDVTLGAGWSVTAEMTSEWDNYLIVSNGDEQVADNDDAEGRGLNATVNTTVDNAGTYTVHACAYSDGRGDYTLHIVTAEGN